jgi:hypothetical protein
VLADGASTTRQQGVYGTLLTFGGILGVLFASTVVERFGWFRPLPAWSVTAANDFSPRTQKSRA